MNKGLISFFVAMLSSWAVPALAADTSQAADARAIYYQIEEPFTINFLTQSEQQVRYLQIKVALKSDDPAYINAAKLNQPMIQDALRTLFSDQRYQDMISLEGRQQLQQDARALVQSLLKQETGLDGLDQIYFTSFILQ